MRESIPPLQKIAGLSFFKLLGSGGGDGFSTRPDFSAYALLTVWESENDFQKFKKSTVFKDFLKHSYEFFETRLKAIMARGKWNDQNPFANQGGEPESPQMAVVTRASIKKRKLIQFWRNVPGVSSKLFEKPGVIFAKGIGEWPFVEQATLSIWNSAEAMQAFAYNNKEHAEVIKKTRQLDWYSEEMFTRFEVVYLKGQWKGESLISKTL